MSGYISVSQAAVIQELPRISPEVTATWVNANSITFNGGRCQVENASRIRRIVEFPTLTKSVNLIWAAGNGMGGLDTGSVANTTYHCYAIWNPNTNEKDYIFSLNASAPTYPSGYSYRQRVCSITRVSGANREFGQFGKYFWYPTQITVFQGNPSSAGEYIVLPVPTGIRVVTYGMVSLADPLTTSGSAEHAVGVGNGDYFASNGIWGPEKTTFNSTVGCGTDNADFAGGARGNNTEIIKITNLSGQLHYIRGLNYSSGTLRTVSFTHRLYGYEDFSL